MDKEQFATFVAAQFEVFSNSANNAYWLTVMKKNKRPISELENAADAFVLSASILGGNYALSRGAVEELEQFKREIKNAAAFVIKQVKDELRSHNIREALNIKQTDTVFSALSLKKQDSIGRSWPIQYAVEKYARHFAVLADAKQQVTALKAMRIEFVDILNSGNEIVASKVPINNVFGEKETLSIFHPNSNLRILAHVAQA